MGLKEETIIKIIEECIKPLSGLKNGFEKQENRADEIAENLPPEKYPSVSAVIAFVKNKIEVFSEAVGKVYLKATDFEDYKTDASNTYAKKTDVENFENNVADTYATKTDVEDFENNVAETYATKTDVEDFENNVAKTYATKTDVEDLKTDTEVIATATGSAITIESANAPLQQLKLYGKTTQDGTPTPDNPIELKSVGDSGSYNVDLYGRNLCDPNIFNSMNHNGAVGSDFDSATYTLTMLDNATDSSGRYGVVHFPFEIGKEYTLSFDIRGTEGRSVRCGFDSKSITLLLTNQFKRYSVTITAYSKTQIIIMYSNSAEIGGLLAGEYMQFANVQIEEGTQATPYEPCNKKTFTNKDILRGIGDIADEKDLARGVKTQRIKEVLAKDYTLYPADSNDNYFIAYIGETGYPAKNIGVSSHLPHISSGLGYETGFFVGSYFSSIHISIPKTIASDVTTLRQWLIDNNVKFYYPIAEPIETPISETELNAYRQLYTNKGNTTFISEADMEISYYVNRPNAQAIGNIHSQVNADYFKLSQAIISVGGN